LVNFYKRRLLANVIYQIDKTKKESYQFKSVKIIQNYINDIQIMNDEELETVSGAIMDETANTPRGLKRQISHIPKITKKKNII